MAVSLVLGVPPCPSGPYRPRSTGGMLQQVGGSLWRMVSVVALCVAAAVACTGEAAEPVGGTGSAPGVTRQAVPTPAAPASFSLTVQDIVVDGMDNAAILGAAGAPPSNEAAVRAVAGARDALAAFLDAQLVADGTRFTAGPIDGLLSTRARAAVTDQDRAGLGQTAVDAVRTVAGPASARAHVLLVGEQVDAVTLTYEALLTLVLGDDTELPARQSGAMTFVPTPEGWRADAVEVTTDLPQATP